MNGLMKKVLLLGAVPFLAAGLALFLTWTPSAQGAEEVLTTCTAETQAGLMGLFASDQSACAVPSGTTVTRTVLTTRLDDGGEVFLNGSQIYSVPNSFGVKDDTREINSGLSGGQNLTLRVEARNAVDSNGQGIGPVEGRAVLTIYGTRAAVGAVTCSPKNQNVQPNQAASFSASGGNGTFSWSGGGNPASGNSSNFSTTFPNTGTFSVTVASGGSTDTCQVAVSTAVVTPPPVSPLPLFCMPFMQTVNAGQAANFAAVGGDGNYSWSGGENPGTGSGSNFSTVFSAPGARTVTVSSAGKIAQCSAIVNQGFAPPAAAPIQIGPINTGNINNNNTNTNTNTNTNNVNVNVSGVIGTSTSILTSSLSPTLTLTANPGSIQQGQSSVLSWSSQNANQCTAFGGWSGSKALSGSETVAPGANTSYFMTCSNSSGQQVTAQAFVAVGQIGSNLPIVTIYSNPQTIFQGQSSVLSWSSQNAASCFASGSWSGQQSTAGSLSVSPSLGFNTYTLTCSNSAGSNSAQASVNVLPFTSMIGGGQLQVTKSVLNRTLNQTAYFNSVQAQGLDVLEFQIVINNFSGQTGQVSVQDMLPTQFYYVPGSTRVNGATWTDGIASGPINIGTLNAGQQMTVRFWATLYYGVQPQTITNQVSVTISGMTQTANATIQVQNRAQAQGVAYIVTGADDALPAVLGMGFLASLAFYLLAFRMKLVPFGALGVAVPGSLRDEFESLAERLRRFEKRPDTDPRFHA